MKQLNIRIEDDELLQRVKVHCIKSNLTLGTLVINLLKSVVDSPAPQAVNAPAPKEINVEEFWPDLPPAKTPTSKKKNKSKIK